MKVGLDTSALVHPFSRGLVRVTRGLVEALERRGLLAVERLAPSPGQGLRRWRHRELARRVRERGLVGIHSLTSAFPLTGPGLRVQTVHELPWRHGVAENADLGHRLWARWGWLRAARVVVPSERVARDLATTPARARRIRVIPWGVDPAFGPNPPPGRFDEALLERYRVGDRPFVLAPGADRAKKNLRALLAGLAELARRGDRDLCVVVTGRDTPDLRRDLGTASRLGLAGRVSTVGEVPDEELPAWMRLAEAVAVLSPSEGFGLPALEALACGSPPLVTRESAQAEVAGEQGIPCDPSDPASVADAIARAREERPAHVEERCARAGAYSWDACAASVETLWQELLG